MPRSGRDERRVGRVAVAMRDASGLVVPGHDYATWATARAEAALRDVGMLLVGGTGGMRAATLRDGCEAFLDKATTRDAIALYEFSERAIERAGPDAVVSVEPVAGHAPAPAA